MFYLHSWIKHLFHFYRYSKKTFTIYFLVISASWSGSSLLLLFCVSWFESCWPQEDPDSIPEFDVSTCETLGILVSSNCPDFVSPLLELIFNKNKHFYFVQVKFVQIIIKVIYLCKSINYLLFAVTEGIGVANGSNPSLSWMLGNFAAAMFVIGLWSKFLSLWVELENLLTLICCLVGESTMCNIGNESRSYYLD